VHKEMKIKDLKKLIEKFNDEDEVAIEIDEEVYNCFGYELDYKVYENGTPTLVIAQDLDY